MANSDKNILIYPNVGFSSEPNITFLGANTSLSAQTIILKANTANGGSLIFSDSIGNDLFIIRNGLTSDAELSVTGNVAISQDATIGRALAVGAIAPDIANTGSIRASNDITAFFSDKRLKNIESNIPNALEKLLQINGVYYTENELAESLGFNNKGRRVGVIAQEIQEVLPEVIKPAPFDRISVNGQDVSKSGQEYLTVQYEKIVPLLIEAIKELSDKVDKLERGK
jgi:hypothetical protein